VPLDEPPPTVGSGCHWQRRYGKPSGVRGQVSRLAVLVRLSDEHGADAGKWFMEAGFGRVDHPNPPMFENLDEAQAWIEQRLALVA
jgi:hypothetical protein